ncbi:MAG: hypothetical protein ACRC3H_19520 [Lachnospiraceae bacterium]
MKRQIRKSVFETNSSSTHSICITNSDIKKNHLPRLLVFKHGQYGWECDNLYTTEERASYLYQIICDLTYEEDAKRIEYLNHIIVVLSNVEVECEFETDKNDDWDTGYVDHAKEAEEFLNALMEDDDKLLRYLFSSGSFVLTGNDNSDDNVSIYVDYPHEEYYKGNGSVK